MDETPRPSSSRLNPVKVYGGGGGGASRASTPAKASPLLNGILVGIVAAVAWAVIVYVTGYEIAWVAWGVGALVGLAVAKSSHEPNASLGPTAAALAAGSLILAKVLIVEFAAPSMLRQELLKNPETTAAMFLVDMRMHKSFSPDVQATIEQLDTRAGSLSEEQRFELQQHVQSEALARSRAATPAERQRVVGVSVDSILEAMGFFGVLKSVFTLRDFIWLGLAISSAFKVAQRG